MIEFCPLPLLIFPGLKQVVLVVLMMELEQHLILAFNATSNLNEN